MNKKTMIDEIIEKDVSIETDKHIQQFQKSLSKDVKKIVKETDALVSASSDSAVSALSTNLEISYNFSTKLRDILPVNSMLTDDIRKFEDIEFTNAHLSKFVRTVLCPTLGRNYDQVQEQDPYYYDVLRRCSVVIAYDLVYDVIEKTKNAFSNPVGRTPKKILISMKDINKNDDLKKKYNKDGGASAYVSFEELTSIAKHFLLGVKDDTREYASKLVKLMRALDEYTSEAKNFDSHDIEIKKEEIELIQTLTCRFLSMLDMDTQFNTIAAIKTFLDDYTNVKNGLINWHKSYDKNKIKCVNFVNFKNNKPIFADNADSLLKQLANQ
jgi:hypothetical protein